jgi:glycosyltransferase involved in cell wall biosynthesis
MTRDGAGSGDEDATVGLVIQNNFPADREVRTRRIAKALDDGGRSVVVFARNALDDPDLGEIEDRVRRRTERLPYATVRRFSWLASTRLSGLVLAPIPLNPVWVLWTLLEFYRQGVDIAISGDLMAGIPTAIAAKLLGVPMVIDVRENYVALAKTLPADSLFDRVAQHEVTVRSLERVTLRLADEVWVVVDERREQLVETGVPASKITVVSNTPELPADETQAGERDDGNANRFEWEGFVLVYVGLLKEFRGLDLVLNAVAHLDANGGTDVHFAVAGDGPHRTELEARCEHLGIEDHVSFVGWIDPGQVPAFLEAGDAGVIPHAVTPLTTYTVPNKLFDYMLAGLPVLATDMAPVRRIVTEEDCGTILPRDPSDAEVAGGIRRLRRSDPEKLGSNGRDAVYRRYNWDHDAERVRHTVATLSAQ